MHEIYADMRFATVSLAAIWVKIFWQLTGTTLKIFRALNSIIGRFEWIPFKLFSGQVGRPSRFGLRLAVVVSVVPLWKPVHHLIFPFVNFSVPGKTSFEGSLPIDIVDHPLTPQPLSFSHFLVWNINICNTIGPSRGMHGHSHSSQL